MTGINLGFLFWGRGWTVLYFLDGFYLFLGGGGGGGSGSCNIRLGGGGVHRFGL